MPHAWRSESESSSTGVAEVERAAEQLVEHLVGAGALLARRQPRRHVSLGAQPDVVEHRARLGDQHLLEHRDDALCLRRARVRIATSLAVTASVAGVGPVDAAEDLHERALARAVLADERVNLSARSSNELSASACVAPKAFAIARVTSTRSVEGRASAARSSAAVIDAVRRASDPRPLLASAAVAGSARRRANPSTFPLPGQLPASQRYSGANDIANTKGISDTFGHSEGGSTGRPREASQGVTRPPSEGSAG